MPMTPEQFLEAEIIPAMAWLTTQRGRDMGPPEVLVQLLATALHEGDWLKARVQYGSGPITKRYGHSMWMFEGGQKAALAGIMANPVTSPSLEAACEWLGVEYAHDHVWWCMVGNDKLAAICGRLLLLTDPHPIPLIDDVADSYATYLRCWRPGAKPGIEKWRKVHACAVEAVTRINSAIPELKDKPVASNRPDPNATITMAQLQAMLQPAAMNATAGVAMTEKQLQTFRDQALIVSPPSVGNQVIVSPPASQTKITQQALAVIGILPIVAQSILQVVDPLAAAAHNNDWASMAGLVLSSIASAGMAYTEGKSIKVAGQVATAAADPVGATPIAMPLPDLSQIPDSVVDAIEARLRARQVPENAA